MANYNAIKDNGDTDEVGALRFLFRLFRPGYGSGLNVTQRGAGANMSVDVQVGDILIHDTDRAYWGWADAVNNVSISAADPTNPRLDIVVAYIDKAVSTTTPNNNLDGLKFLAVAGTPAGSPTDPSDGTIQTAVGAGNPFKKLARVAVAASDTNIVDGDITDIRNPAALAIPNLYGGNNNTNGHSVPNVADDILQLLAAAQSPTNKTYTGTTNKMRAGGASSVLRDSADVQMDLENRFDKQSSEFDWVESGIVWSGDSYGSTRAASMTSGVVVINGKRITVSAVSAQLFTASRDTYVDIGEDGTVDYNEVTNNAASPALAAGHIRVAIIVTGASSIAAVGSVNQGQEDKVLPIASSIPYQVTDSLGNLICNRSPNARTIGFRRRITDLNFTTQAEVPELVVPVLVPTGRKVKITLGGSHVLSAAAAFHDIRIYDGRLGSAPTLLTLQSEYIPGAGQSRSTNALAFQTPTTSSKTYSVTVTSGSGTAVLKGATTPAFLLVELV